LDKAGGGVCAAITLENIALTQPALGGLFSYGELT
jgi:hypothetical protein